MTLPPFDPFAACAKCGSTEAFIAYRNSDRCLHDTGDSEVWSDASHERLHRQCRTCGYMWDEAVLAEHTS